MIVDLGPFDGASQVFVRFHFQSDAEISNKGFYVDDMVLTASTGSEAYQFMSGTSMAAAFVSGIGALVLSLNPDYSIHGIKSAIVDSVDFDQDLTSRILSGGRVNAFNALALSQNLSFSQSSGQSSGSGGGGCFLGSLVD